MITRVVIEERVREWGLREDVIEKDYVLGWLLWGIGSDDVLAAQWVFKGGACLKKCYIETWRFSEDLDFTVIPGGPIRQEDVLPALLKVLQSVQDASGINFSDRPPMLTTHASGMYTEGRVYYRGPRNAPSVASVRLDLSASEKIARPSVLREIAHDYPDKLPNPAVVRCYSFEEIRIQSIKVTTQPFKPVYRVEISATGRIIAPDLTRTQREVPFRSPGFHSPGLVYIIRCPSCGREFKRRKFESTLKPHKGRGGWQCHSLIGYLVRSVYE